ncbi:MAG: hypothetical protein PHR35_01180 [Kiritimatiellae bacterium]|nr:hypothetical protein [Kiritimatiellia bacterium]
MKHSIPNPSAEMPAWLTRNVRWFVTDWRVSKLMPITEGGVAEAPCIGLADRTVGWKELQACSGNGVAPFVNVHSLFEHRDGLVYLAHRLDIVQAGEWELLVGHDGGIRMFVDGKHALTEPALLNPLCPARSAVRLPLSKGQHEIVIAFDLAAGMGWGIMFQAHPADSAPRAKTIMIDDLSIGQPSEALSPRREPGHWKVLPYEAQGFSGKCVCALVNTGAPELTIPLNVQGWHAVYLGLGSDGINPKNNIRVKLSGDAAFQHRGQKYGEGEEVLFKCADLTGQDLVIAQQSAGYSQAACLYFVKLVPMTEKEVEALRRDCRQRETKRLISTIDGFSFIYEHMPTTKAELLEEFEPYRGSDFGTIWWQYSGADTVNYRSRLGTIAGENTHDFPRPGDRYFVQAVKTLIERGIDITKVAVEACHDMGIDIHIGMRPCAWKGPPPFEESMSSNFYTSHPEWRCRDRDGTSLTRMSFAVPEVRQHLLGIFREVLDARPEGLNMLYNRGIPVVLWEDAFCDRFRAKYAEDARKVPEDDTRLHDLRAEIMTGWMREVRQLLDSFQREQGLQKRLALSAMCTGTEADNRMAGLDVPLWIREGLIDQIGIWDGGARGMSSQPMDVAYYRRITAGTGVTIHPSQTAWTLPTAEAVLRHSLERYDAGADGLLFWDANAKVDDGLLWPMIGRMGHVEEMRARAAMKGRSWPATGEIRHVGEEPASRWSAWEGF